MKTLHIFCVLLATCLLLNACVLRADFDIRGKWKYTMTAANGNTYDTGVISFSGDPAKSLSE